MWKFNIRQTGKDLLKILEKELPKDAVCRLTIDVLIPEILTGDKEGLCHSIKLICRYLTKNAIGVIIDIDLFKTEEKASRVQLSIEVKSFTRKENWNIPGDKDLMDLISQLPYETQLNLVDLFIQFRFSMDFECHGDFRIIKPFANRNILLAEDDEVSAAVFIAFMEEWGCKVDKVIDGDLAIEAARTKLYDIILMDMYMPRVSGLEAIKGIRALDKTVPIVALVSASFTVESGLTSVDDFLLKPIGSIELRKTLSRYL